jgi:uncharacterized protein (DUF2252 family)
VWSCGDLHLENFGSYKGDDRLPYFDVNDFDESLLAPASWDAVRLLTSLRVGAKTLGIQAEEADRLCGTFLLAYGEALGQGKARWVDARTADGQIRTLLDSLRDRSRKSHLNSLTGLKGRRRCLNIDGSKALPASEDQRDRVNRFMAAYAKSRADPAFFTVLDVARRIAGTGSLGLDRYVILVEGKGSPDANYLLDLKEARPSALAGLVRLKQPEWTSEAHRVVALQQRMQAVSMAFLQPVTLARKPYVLRGLQAAEDRVALDGDKQSFVEIEKTVACMGRVVAWGQLRSSGRQGSATADELMAFAQGRKWRSKLQAASADCAARVFEDARDFAVAYDDGAFGAAPDRAARPERATAGR